MKFDVTILGCGAATPTLLRNSSSQIVNVHDKPFLVDCGEGTQLQLRKHKIKFQRISHIFISHLHGDHYLGLMGLMSSMHLLGRKGDLHMYGPPDLKEIIETNLRLSGTRLSFACVFHPTQTEEDQVVYEDDTLRVRSIPLKHRIHCTGFIFEEKERDRKMIKHFIEEHSIGLKEIIALKRGKDVERESGEVLVSSTLTEPPSPARTYAYCSDTIYDEDLVKYLSGVNALYHEATFADELADRAEATFHSTASQAAKIAQLSEVGKLVIGHFSSRYPKTDDLLLEAKAVFKNTWAAFDGLVFDIPHITVVDKSATS